MASSYDELNVLLVGDCILDEPDPDRFFESSRLLLRNAGLMIGHVEVPHTSRGEVASNDVPAPPAKPEHLRALAAAGFGVATLAGNHIADAGPAGIEDTIAELTRLGVVTCGAGMTLAEARRPAVVERAGRTIGTLSYNCVGPKASWATSQKPGCAYLRVLTHYELDHATPGGPPEIFTFATPDSLELMRRDIVELRARVDLVVVALHKGIGHVPAKLAMYEQPVARAAVDAGADVVVGHHAHILRGIEVYRGKPIFHGLGNFVTVTRALTPGPDSASEERRAWARRRRELFGFEPDPQMPHYPFHPESRNTMIAEVTLGSDGRLSAGFYPCHIDGQGCPHPLGLSPEGRRVASYVEDISRAQGLSVKLQPAGDRMLVMAPP
ncbi:MAG: CapA family protein [Myxococcales bacterium]|nr:CapA family protein [Myxococcales bacterium]